MNQISRKYKIIAITGIIIILLLSLKLPSLARYKNRIRNTLNIWNGDIAIKYKSGTGTQNDPYIISNGEELAYFSSQLENNTYENTYFKITDDIIINPGKFIYDGEEKYIIDGNTYYIEENDYYIDDNKMGSLNIFPKFKNFKGNLDGDFHTLYGIYNNSESATLFENLSGNIQSLYIENAMMIGTNEAAILTNKLENGTIKNILVDGYSITNDGPASGIILQAINSEISNCINKADVYGNQLSSAIVSYDIQSPIINSYNNGNIIGTESGVIGEIIDSNITISNIYNKGNLIGENNGLIIKLENSELTLNNSFIVTDDYLINEITESTVTGENNYYTSENINIENSTLTTLENLKNKQFLTGYSEFIDFEDIEINNQNVWVFEDMEYPVLYIDDILNPLAELYVNTYTWDTFNPFPELKKISNNLTFKIEDKNELNESIEKYYYISSESLTKQELQEVEWENYDQIVQISEEGYYVIYIKLVDDDGAISYINSDILALDNTPSEIQISMDNNNWNSLNNETIYINQNKNITISASDDLSGVKTLEYYISNDFLTNEQLNNIDTWTLYENTISIEQIGTYVIYAKVVDNCDYVNYAQTPKIIYDGYTITKLTPFGIDDEANITRNSKLKLDVIYQNNNEIENPTHNIVSSFNLPKDTKITLMDYINNKVYEYKVQENDTNIYPFTLFKEKGKIDSDNYSEQKVANEHYQIIIDFENSVLLEDHINEYIYLNIKEDNLETRPTLENTKKYYSIYKNKNLELEHELKTDYSGEIIYNSDSETTINIKNIINYQKNNEKTIYDTNYSDKKIGLSIKMIDGEGNIVETQNLKNIMFSINDFVYTPGPDSIIRINLNTNESIDTELKITTHQIMPKLKEGTYYLEIEGYKSYDGLYYDDTIGKITIPVIVSNSKIENNYSFDVILENENRIIEKENSIVTLDFKILLDQLENPSVKIKMQKKDELTAYNQDYSLIDLKDYTNDNLTKYIDNIYNVTLNNENIFTLNINTENLEKTGYNFIFDLYDGNKKVSTINKYFIVR